MTSHHPKTSRSLPIALLRARERVMGPIRDMLSGVGLTEQQWRVLRVLDEDGPMEPTRIAELACLLLPSLTRILQKLADKGLITRRPDDDDKRKQIIQISEAGEALIEAHLPASLAVLEQTKAQIGAERYEALLDLLNAVEAADAKRAPD
ncbi:homoprotocatechuate degradation operon regulator HpaR [Sedimentitalea sp. XS_ASV28]|uniref:homoprotocatechuate degradation operon regulator HpaR n=1 Tax=Sedimentitalea sp. XS_ASV28 TaxID=3241296 RepID=UPI003515CC8F